VFDFMQDLSWWHWLVLAVALAALEALMPGAIAIWFAASAAVVGVLLLAFGGLSWVWQWLLFAGLGLIATIAYRNFYRKGSGPEDAGNLNQRGVQYIGQTYTLSEAITQGRGKARIGDGTWIVSGPDAPAGAKVRVTGADGTLLQVERVEP
jgi:membrane protein implicated in regulation of membrane protease activity